MLSHEKYYSNPFADDDDELCYADIDMDYGDEGATSKTSPQHSHYAAAGEGGRDNSSAAAASASALRQQLEEANNANQTLHDEYEGFIESLREELAAANNRNNELLAKQNGLEARIRALTLEKETAEWTVKQEKERNEVLENNIAAIQNELRNSRSTERPTNHFQPEPELPRQPSWPQQNEYVGMPTSNAYSDSLHSSTMQPQQRNIPSNSPGGATRTRMVPVTRKEHLERQQAAGGHKDPNATMNAGHGGESRQLQRQPSAPNPRNAASVQELDAMLLYHSQRRDELSSELQRLDGARMRSAADRRKFHAVEASLEDADRQIGHIRLLMRNKNAAKK